MLKQCGRHEGGFINLVALLLCVFGNLHNKKLKNKN